MAEESVLYDCSDEGDVARVANLYAEPAVVKDFIMRNCTSDGVTYWRREELVAYLAANGFCTNLDTADA